MHTYYLNLAQCIFWFQCVEIREILLYTLLITKCQLLARQHVLNTNVAPQANPPTNYLVYHILFIFTYHTQM